MQKKTILISLVVACSALFSACTKDDPSPQKILTVNNDTDFLSLNHESHIGDISIVSQLPWTVSTDADWIELAQSNGLAGNSKLNITLEANDNEARFATLKFVSKTNTFDFIVSQSAANQNFDSPTHYFYVTFGTMPTLYAGLYMLAIQKPSYFFFERAKTFDPNKLPSYVTNAQEYVEDQTKMRDYMKAKILEINHDNPTAVFGLMVDDLRSRLGYDWFVSQGIDSSRVKVTLLSDGTATYNEFYEMFSDNTTAETTWKEYASTVEALNWNHNGKYPAVRSLPEFESWGFAYYISTRPNYRLLMQYRSLLETDSPFIKDQITKMNLLSRTPEELLNDLSSDNKNRFYEMAKFSYDEFLAKFEASVKPNLIIIGTDGLPEEQHNYTEQIFEKYGITHDIFFKPHPSDVSSADYETDFPGLKLLPGQMPFEIFVWSLINEIDIVGGFPSTVYLTIPKDKVKFIFAPDAQSMTRPLNLLFADAPNVEWIQ